MQEEAAHEREPAFLHHIAHGARPNDVSCDAELLTHVAVGVDGLSSPSTSLLIFPPAPRSPSSSSRSYGS
eukprot:3678141-Pyramimonas_sp.AAC.1